MSINQLDLNILKVLISNKQYALDFVNEYDTKVFSAEVWNFADMLIKYIKTFRQIPSLKILIERSGKNNQTTIDHITKSWNQVEALEYDERDYIHDLEKLKKRFFDKQIIHIKGILEQTNPDEIDVKKSIREMTTAISNINQLSNGKGYDRRSLKDAIPGFIENYQAIKKNPNLEQGIKTGYSYIDYAINGVRSSDMILVIADTGFGKSLFLSNLAVNMWMQKNTIEMSEFSEGKNIIYFSLEMPYHECFTRIISKMASVNARRIEKCILDNSEMKRLKKALDFIKNYPYTLEIVDISACSTNDIAAVIDECKYKPDCILIDYLGIMDPNDKQGETQDWLRQGIIAFELKQQITRRKNIPIITAAQANRKAQGKESESVGLHRIARSASVSTHCSQIIQLENRGEIELNSTDLIAHLLKNRRGEKNKFSLLKDLPNCSLIDLPITIDEFVSYTDQEDISSDLEVLDI